MCLFFLKKIFVSCFFSSMEMTWKFCIDLQQWLLHYKKVTFSVVHCGKHIQYTEHLGSSGDWLLLYWFPSGVEVNMQILKGFWDRNPTAATVLKITLSSEELYLLGYVNRSSGWIYRLHLQDRRVGHARNLHEASNKQNVGSFSLDYMALYTGRQNSS
jgi:hypothetical protein